MKSIVRIAGLAWALQGPAIAAEPPQPMPVTGPVAGPTVTELRFGA